MKQLSPRRARFVEEYLVDLDARAAAARAGYKTDGTRRYADWLRREPEVAAAIRAGMAERAQRVGIDTDQVVRELIAIAFSDIRNVVSWRALKPASDEDGEIGHEVRVTDSDDLDPATAAAICAISRTSKGAVSVRLHDKLSALIQLGRHLGMFTPRLEVTTRKSGWEKVDRDFDARWAAMTPERAAALREAMHKALGKPFGPLPKD